MSVASQQRTDSIVVVRVSLNVGRGLDPSELRGLLAGVAEYVALAVCLEDRRFVPLKRRPDGLPGTVPKEPVTSSEVREVQIKPTGLGRGPGEGDFVGWQLIPGLFEQVVNSENITLLITQNLLRVRSFSYRNPVETVLEILLPASAGGGLVSFLTWATSLKATRRKAAADLNAARIAADLAVAQESRDAREAAERLASMRSSTVKLLSQIPSEEAQARYIAAQADALELENLKQRMLIAQELEDYVQRHPRMRTWTEEQLAALLRPPITQKSIEAMAAFKPIFELVREDRSPSAS